MTAETDLETRIERLEEVAERWDRPDNPGGRRIARRARDKADGMRAARRIIAPARREAMIDFATWLSEQDELDVFTADEAVDQYLRDDA